MPGPWGHWPGASSLTTPPPSKGTGDLDHESGPPPGRGSAAHLTARPGFRSADYFHLGQLFLKVSDARIGDLRAAEVQLPEVGQALQIHQPGVASAGRLFKVECLQALQPPEACQAGVGDLGALE